MANMPASNGKYPDYNRHQQWETHPKTATTAIITDPFVTLRPFFESWTIGFDRQLELMRELRNENKSSTYPPFNIVRNDETHHTIELAVAGFNKEDITIQVQESELTVEGDSWRDDVEGTVLHKGISSREWKHKFALAEYTVVTGAELKNGMLTINLEQQLPKEKQPITIKLK
jgi:molecular chaperone IbpA